jgi:hypothetical protein
MSDYRLHPITIANYDYPMSDRHNITEILLKMTLNTTSQTKPSNHLEYMNSN